MDGKWLIQKNSVNEYFDSFEEARTAFLNKIQERNHLPEIILMLLRNLDDGKEALELMEGYPENKEKLSMISHFKYIGEKEDECIAVILNKGCLKADYYQKENNYYLHTNILTMNNPEEIYELDYSDKENKYKIKLGHLSNDDFMVIKAFGKNYELGLPVFEYCDDDLSDELKEKSKWHKFKE